MDQATLIDLLPGLVETHWGQEASSVERIDGPIGMGSTTALVTLADGRRYAAKWVREEHAAALDHGSEISMIVESTGLNAAAPLPSTSGDLSMPIAGGAVALLRFVEGRPLDHASTQDQQRIASVLVRVHEAEPPIRRAAPFLADVLDSAQAVEPWIIPAIAAMKEEYAGLPDLTWGVLHTDPAADAFFHDATTDRVGLIDWTGATRGPILYDLASALMYVGGLRETTPFWTAYLERTSLDTAEFVQHIDTFKRFRGAIQAAYFSGRVANADMTGIAHADENWKGLHDARRMLTGR